MPTVEAWLAQHLHQTKVRERGRERGREGGRLRSKDTTDPSCGHPRTITHTRTLPHPTHFPFPSRTAAWWESTASSSTWARRGAGSKYPSLLPSLPPSRPLYPHASFTFSPSSALSLPHLCNPPSLPPSSPPPLPSSFQAGFRPPERLLKDPGRGPRR